MQKNKKLLIFTFISLIFILIVTIQSHSKEILRINKEDISKHNIKYESSYVMGFTEDSKYLLLVDKERDAKLIKEGKNTKILVIPISNPKEKFIIYTPAYKIENYIQINENEILIIGDDSTKIYKINLDTKTTTKEYKLVEKDKEGVRLKAGFYTKDDKNNLYLLGAFFDKNQIFEDPSYYWIKTKFTEKIEFLEKVTNTTEVENKVGKVRMFYWSSPYDAVFTKLVGEKPSELYLYSDNKLTLLDKQHYIFEIALYKKDYVIYPFSQSEESLTNFLGIFDIKNNKKYTYPSPFKKPFIYPFVNDNGIIVIATLDMKKNEMDFYFTSKQENFILHRFIKEYPIGSFKISNQNYYSLQTKDFISVGKIEKTENEKAIEFIKRNEK